MPYENRANIQVRQATAERLNRFRPHGVSWDSFMQSVIRLIKRHLKARKEAKNGTN